MNKNTYKIGKLGEEMAEKFLKERGYKIIDKNYHSLFGEIDIIAVKKDILNFIEVKFRSNEEYGDIHFAINNKKKERLIKTAYFFLINNTEYKDFNMQFDAIFIKINDNKKYEISLMENIFFIDNNIKGFY